MPDWHISIDSVAAQKGVIAHFSVAVEHRDRAAAKRLADKTNTELPDAKARERKARLLSAVLVRWGPEGTDIGLVQHGLRTRGLLAISSADTTPRNLTVVRQECPRQ